MQTAPSPQLATRHPRLPPATAETSAELRQYLTFLLADEMFAIGICAIREIIEYGQVTEVPMVPSFIRGVINLRGAVVPVVDLAARFGRQAVQTSRRTCIVIIEISREDCQHQMGIVVDAVSEVLEIPAGDIEPPPRFGVRIRTDFISGMAKVNGRFVVVLEIDSILSLDELSAVTELAGSESEATD